MDIFVLRPLLTALLEYFFAGYSLKYGKYYPRLVAAFFIFLGTYQLGEFILFTTKYDTFSVNLSFFSTTMLPPIGVLFLQKIQKKNFGYIIFQLAALFFGLTLILRPNIFVNADECYCFSKYVVSQESWHQDFADSWAAYYIFTLTYSMGIAGFYAIRSKVKEQRSQLAHFFLTYSLFFPTSYIAVRLLNQGSGYLPSVMCALAVFGAIVVFRLSLKHKSNPADDLALPIEWRMWAKNEGRNKGVEGGR